MASSKRNPIKNVAVLDLDGHPFMARITGFLRDESSARLDVNKIAALYDEDLKRFAAALKVSPAELRRTPHANKYQDFLTPFEQSARILPMLKNRNQFSAWAKTSNEELGGKTPIEMLFGDRASARKLVETVEGILVGQLD